MSARSPEETHALIAAALNADVVRRTVSGDVLLPGEAAFESVRRSPIGRFHDVCPQAIVRCATPADVIGAIAFARRRGLELAVRAGGHCFAGRSSTRGVLVDVSPMNAVSLADGVATVGAGARLGDVYDALEPHGRTIAGGCGPTVGIAGLTLGGGLGILGRRHGLTSDQLVAAQVVLADGRIVDCDEHRHAGLFWALRGAGGGQFGVVTTLVLRTLPAPTTTTLHLQWPDHDAVAVIEAWQAWAPDAPDELAASLLVTAASDPARPPVVHVFGAMLGSEAATTELVAALVARTGAEPTSVELREQPYRQAKRDLVDNGPEGHPSSAAHGFIKSEFFRRALPTEAIAAVIEHLGADRAAGESRVLDFSPWGGAYNRVRDDATAFAHRAERFLLKHEVAVDADAATAQRDGARAWLARSWALVHPFGSGRAYPNFPDPELDDWPAAYHATNYHRLTRVKAAYDPDDVFRHHQSLPPSGAG